MKKRGKIVITKKNKKGIVYDDAIIINDKINVTLDDNTQMLCDPKTLKLIGYVN